MELSPTIELVWHIAGQEAVAASRAEIESEHFFCALLKFAELNDDELKGITNHPLAAKILTTERNQVRALLKERDIPTTRARHHLRQILGRGNQPHPAGPLHRSTAAHQLFERAAQIVRDPNGLLESPHLLQALLDHPTPALTNALQAVGAKTSSAETPDTQLLLDRWTLDVLQLAKNKTDAPAVAMAQVHVLARALETPNAEPLLLVCEPRVAALPIVARAARALHDGKRIAQINLTTLRQDAPTERALAARFAELFAQAGGVAGLTLWVDVVAEDPRRVESLLSALKPQLARGRVIVTISVMTHHLFIETDPATDDLFRTIWLHDLADTTLPKQW